MGNACFGRRSKKNRIKKGHRDTYTTQTTPTGTTGMTTGTSGTTATTTGTASGPTLTQKTPGVFASAPAKSPPKSAGSKSPPKSAGSKSPPKSASKPSAPSTGGDNASQQSALESATSGSRAAAGSPPRSKAGSPPKSKTNTQFKQKRPDLRETRHTATGVIVHKKGEKMRKPFMEVKLQIPEPAGMMANDQQQKQQDDKPVKLEQILELPPKAVRGPPPLTPFPEPKKGNVVSTLADPPGGWENITESSSSSTSTNDLLAKVPLFGGGDDPDDDDDDGKAQSRGKGKSKK